MLFSHPFGAGGGAGGGGGAVGGGGAELAKRRQGVQEREGGKGWHFDFLFGGVGGWRGVQGGREEGEGGGGGVGGPPQNFLEWVVFCRKQFIPSLLPPPPPHLTHPLPPHPPSHHLQRDAGQLRLHDLANAYTA